MLDTISSGLRLAYHRHTAASCFLLATMVLALDYATGKSIQFPIAYALPVGLAAWRGHRRLAFATALLLPLARLSFHVPWQETQSLAVALVNLPINICALGIYALLMDLIARQKIALERKVKVLEGILPVCASCKKIRNQDGSYEQIEKYISEHSEASFSHGLCPECAKKLYPDYFPD